MVADHTRENTVAGLARAILADAPPRFALAGLSMGGYIAFEIVRRAPERVLKLALLDTSARADTPEQAKAGGAGSRWRGMARLPRSPGSCFPGWCMPAGREDTGLKALVEEMAAETGADRLHPPADRQLGQAGFAAGACGDTRAQRWCWLARATS